MATIDAVKLYKQIKKGSVEYKESVHCPMIIDVMNKEGTMTAFCKKAGISDREFYRWTAKHPLFEQCYDVGRMISKSNWEEEGRRRNEDPDFDMDYWKTVGASRYGVGKVNRVRVAVVEDDNPYKQYTQLMKQAQLGEFTASEIKQLMEAINVGRTAFETIKLQEEIDQLTADLQKIKKNSHGNNIIPITKATKTD